MHFSSVWICNETVQSSLVAWNLQNFKSVGDWSVEYMRACIFKCIMACVVYTVVLQNCWASRVFLDHALIYIAWILVKYKTQEKRRWFVQQSNRIKPDRRLFLIAIFSFSPSLSFVRSFSFYSLLFISFSRFYFFHNDWV